MQQRLYVLTDQELSPVYACVQGSHAVAQYVLDSPDSPWKNDYLIFLKADLQKVTDLLDFHKVDRVVFKEPDLDNKITAIAVLNNGHLFKKLRTV